jgi:hypothetical protein
LKANAFNDYQNNFWCPHFDKGYTGIVYLNDYTGAGTNLYDVIGNHDNKVPEHYMPWRKKTNYKVIKQLYSKFNRLVIFNSKKFLHGMAIDDDTFFNEERYNVVLFFK